jgi:ankyrin repeat protein/tetratricopeptide (TPR) repeat protein
MNRKKKVVLIVLAALALQIGGIFFVYKTFKYVLYRVRFYKLPLHRAVNQNDVERARALLERGLGSDEKDNKDHTPLHIAAWNGQLEMAGLFLDHRADVNAGDCYKETPLHLAIQGNVENVYLLAILLDRGADIDARNIYRQTPLHLAVATGKRKSVELLLNKGAWFEARDEHGHSPLYYAVYYDQPELLRYLLDRGANVNAYGKDWDTALQAAISNKRRAMVRGLLDHGADVQSFPHHLYSPLYLAAYAGDDEIVNILIEHGARIDQRNRYGSTALYIAARGNKLEVLRTFLRLGADVNARCQGVFLTPLHACAASNFIEGARLLMEHGADVNARDVNLNTPLHCACLSQNEEMINLLEIHGADKDIRNIWDMTPGEFAETFHKEKEWKPCKDGNITGQFDPRAIVYYVNLANYRGRHRNLSHATAFAIGDGTYLLTAAHCVREVIEQTKEGFFSYPVVISSYYGDVFEVEIVAWDDESDVALLKAPWKEHPALILADPEEVENAKELIFASYSMEETPEEILRKTFPRADIDEPVPESSPEGKEMPREIYFGQFPVMKMNPGGGERAFSVAAPLFFAHGCSGSPFILPGSGKVAGVFGKHILDKVEKQKFYHILMGSSVHSISPLIEKEKILSNIDRQAEISPPLPDAPPSFKKALSLVQAMRQGKGRDILDEARGLQNQRADSVQANLFLGWRAYEESRYDPKLKDLRNLVEESFKKAVAQVPESPSAHTSYGLFLEEEGKYDEAAGEYGKAVLLDPDNTLANARFLYSLVEFDPGKAEERGRNLLKLFPLNDRYWFCLAHILRKEKKHEEAWDVIRNYGELRSKPFSTESYYSARSMADLGYPEESGRFFGEAYEEFSDSYFFWEKYCYFLMEYFPEKRAELQSAMDMAESCYIPDWVYPDELDDLRYGVTRCLWGINSAPGKKK